MEAPHPTDTRHLTLLLDEILTQAAEIVRTPHGYLYLLDSDMDRMVIRCASGVFAGFPHHPLSRGEGMAGHVWQTGRAETVDSYRTWEGRLPDPARDVLGAVAGVPLTVGTSTLGVIGLAFIDDRRFDADAMKHLERFARFASLALESALTSERLAVEIAERKRAEESRRLMERIVEQSPVSIVITDCSGVIEYVNPRFCELTGYDAAELLGKTPSLLKSGRTSPEEYRILWETISSGKVWRGEFQNLKKDGSIFFERATIAPLSDERGVITHFVGMKEDITVERSLESQLRHAQKMEAVGRIAAGVAHDFNNILTAIIGYANIVQMNIPGDSTLCASLDKIIASAERGAELTRGLLAFSRRQTGSPQTIDLNDLLSRSRDMMGRILNERITLRLTLSPSPLLVRVDPHELRQVIFILLSNARDAMGDQGTVAIETAESSIDQEFLKKHGFGSPGRYALLTMVDDGTGIEPEHLDKIFEPFYTTRETGKGTGLGLSIAYGIIKGYRGHITVASEVGAGSRFTVYLPLLNAPPAGAEAQVQLSPPRPPVSPTILLAEDDATTRAVTRELLETFGYQVITAEDGTDAFERYALYRDRISIVLLDAVMPGIGGEELVTRIRGIDPDRKIIISSGYGEEGINSARCQLPRLYFLPKPYSPRDLLKMIRKVEQDD